SRCIRSARLMDSTTLRETPPALLVLFQVEFEDGASDLYFVPLAVTSDKVDDVYVLTRLNHSDGFQYVCDLAADEDACRRLLDAIGAERLFGTQSGTIRSVATPAFAALRDELGEKFAIEVKPATSSNTLVFFGRRLLMKLFRRVEEGVNPDFEIGNF